MKIYYFFLVLFLSFEAFSAMSSPYIEGIVNNFDDKNVTLIVGGKKVVVSRAAFSKDQKIKGGNRVVAFYDAKLMKEELKAELKKKKKN